MCGLEDLGVWRERRAELRREVESCRLGARSGTARLGGRAGAGTPADGSARGPLRAVLGRLAGRGLPRSAPGFGGTRDGRAPKRRGGEVV